MWKLTEYMVTRGWFWLHVSGNIIYHTIPLLKSGHLICTYFNVPIWYMLPIYSALEKIFGFINKLWFSIALPHLFCLHLSLLNSYFSILSQEDAMQKWMIFPLNLFLGIPTGEIQCTPHTSKQRGWENSMPQRCTASLPCVSIPPSSPSGLSHVFLLSAVLSNHPYIFQHVTTGRIFSLWANAKASLFPHLGVQEVKFHDFLDSDGSFSVVMSRLFSDRIYGGQLLECCWQVLTIQQRA